jgi:hypothetical protein
MRPSDGMPPLQVGEPQQAGGALGGQEARAANDWTG